MFEATKIDWRTIQYASNDLRNNYELMLFTLEKNWFHIHWVSIELKNN